MKETIFVAIAFLVALLLAYYLFIRLIWTHLGIYDGIIINDEYYTVIAKPKKFYIQISNVNGMKTIYVGSLLFKSFHID